MEITEYLRMLSNVTGVGEIGNIGDTLLGFAILGIACIIIFFLFYFASSLDRYKRLGNFFRWLSRIFKYAGYGCLTVAVVGIPCYVGYLALEYGKENIEITYETLITIGTWIGIFMGVVLIGFVTEKRIWKKLFKHHRDIKLKQESKRTAKGICQEIRKDLDKNETKN